VATYQLNMENLVQEVELYNSYSDGEVQDPFGKASDLVNPIGSEGPYYAVKGAAYIYGTVGGLDIDVEMNVLDTKGKQIPGLYAVGQDSMGVLFTPQDAYVSYGGAAQGWVLTSGRIAGANAAEFAGNRE
jgi:predicted oxidoreductase